MVRSPVEVLLVEPSATDVALIRAALAGDRLGAYDVTVIERLSQALSTLRQGYFDVVLLNLDLPDSEGVDTFTSLHDKYPDVPVIVFSDGVDEDVALAVMQAGAQDHLIKGEMSWNLAARAIRYAVERQRAQLSLRANETRWRALVENAPSAIVVVGPDGKVTFVSSSTKNSMGYEPAIRSRNS